MWTYKGIYTQNQTEAGITYIMQAVNDETGESVTFPQFYKQQPDEEVMIQNAQNFVNDIINASN